MPPAEQLKIRLEDVVKPPNLVKFYHEFMEEVNQQKKQIGTEIATPNGQWKLFEWAQDYFRAAKQDSHIRGDIRANQLQYRDVLHVMQRLDNEAIIRHLEKRDDFDLDKKGAHIRKVKLRYTDDQRKDHQQIIEVENYVQDANLEMVLEKYENELEERLPKTLREEANLTLVQNFNCYFNVDGELLVQESSRNKDYSVRKAYKDIAFLFGARTTPANDTSGNQIVSSDGKLLYDLLNDKRQRIGNKNLFLDKKGQLYIPKKINKRGEVEYRKKPILLQYNQEEFEAFKKQAEEINDDYIANPRRVEGNDKERMHYQINMDHLFFGLGVETQFLPFFAYNILESGALAHTERYEKARQEEDFEKYREVGINYIVDRLVQELHELYTPLRRVA